MRASSNTFDAAIADCRRSALTVSIDRAWAVPEGVAQAAERFCARGYCNRVISPPLHEAVLRLLAAGALPGFAGHEAAARVALCALAAAPPADPAALATLPCQALLACAWRGEDIEAICAALPPVPVDELPILRRLCVPLAALPACTRAVELGRLCSAAATDAGGRHICVAPIVAVHALLSAAVRVAWLCDAGDTLCGGTHGVVIDMLAALGFPVTTLTPALTAHDLDPSAPLAQSNLPRLVLGQVSPRQLERALCALAWRNPREHARVVALLRMGYAALGLPGNATCAHDLLGLRFFHMPWDARAIAAHQRMGAIAQRWLSR